MPSEPSNTSVTNSPVAAFAAAIIPVSRRNEDLSLPKFDVMFQGQRDTQERNERKPQFDLQETMEVPQFSQLMKSA